MRHRLTQVVCERRDRESEYGENTQGQTQAAGLGKPSQERRAHEEAGVAHCSHCRDTVSGAMECTAGRSSENERRYRSHPKADQGKGEHREANLLKPQRRRKRECGYYVGATEQPHGTPTNHEAIAGKAHARHSQRKRGVAECGVSCGRVQRVVQ
jgi:hypothetical protein